MTNRWQKFILVSVLMGALIACSKPDDKNNGAPGATDYYASYEAQDGCSTGRQVFTAPSEDDIRSKFCEGLKDQKLNKNCAVAQREQAFKVAQCQGAWPHSTTTGSLSSSKQQYAFSVNDCSTGNHIFVAASDKAVKKMLCEALRDDEFNRNCAKDQRAELARKSGCSEVPVAADKKNETPEVTAETLKTAPAQDPGSTFPKTSKWAELDSAEFKCGTSVCDSSQHYCLKSILVTNTQSAATCQPLPKTCLSNQDAETCLRQAALESLKGTNSCEGEFAVQKSKDRISVRCSALKSKLFFIQPKLAPTRPY